MLFPVACVCGNGNQGQDFSMTVLERMGTSGKPVLDCRAAMAICTIWGIDIDSWKIPCLFQTITVRKAILGIRFHNGPLIGARIKGYVAPEDLSYTFNILGWRAPVEAL